MSDINNEHSRKHRSVGIIAWIVCFMIGLVIIEFVFGGPPPTSISVVIYSIAQIIAIWFAIKLYRYLKNKYL